MSAADQDERVNMNIWDRDIKAVEDAIATIDTIREMRAGGAVSSPPGSDK